ncbi:MAG: DUF3567 family protein [Burkholderiales bacterium]
MINVIYNSDDYYVLGYPDERAYEIVDKRSARGRLFQGDIAARFMDSMRTAVAEDASVEHLDEFLGSFDVLLDVPLVRH